MHRLQHGLLAFAVVCLAGLTACGGGGGGGSPPPPPPAAPSITTQPSGLTVNAGASATFTVVATGSPTYQWQRNGQDISGATSASYTLKPAASANNGDSYTVVASNAAGSVTSTAAALRVTGVAVLAGQIGGVGFADGAATSAARFWGPSALALDSAGNLYVADYNTVRKISAAGVVSTIVGDARSCGELAGAGPAARLCYPFALATDVANNVYASDGSNTAWRISANANMTAYSTAFGCVDSLAVLGPLLYIGDGCAPGAGTIKTLSTTVPGTPATLAGLPASPAGMSFDTLQNIYVASGTTIQQVSSAASVSILAGVSGMFGSADGTGAAARFGCPIYPDGPEYYTTNGAVSIATLSTGTSIVADYCNNTLRAVTSAGMVTTIGGKAGAPGATDANGTAARFFGPAAVLADTNDNVFVADYLNGLIRKITPAGDVTTYGGQMPHAGYADGPAAQAAFRYPFGIVADGDGNLYVSDTYNYVIRKITPDGTVSTLAGTAGIAGVVNATGTAAQFSLPQGIAIDSSGNLYIADNLANQIRKITPAGAVTTFAGLNINIPAFREPTGVAIDAAGNVYVTDLAGVYEVNPTGTAMLHFAALHLATAIAISPSGTVYVTAGSTYNLTDGTTAGGGVYTFAGGTLTPLVTNTGFSARVDGIVVGGDGNLYVSDILNSVIKRVTPAGVITVVAGAPDLPIGTAPGGLPAKINSPAGLALLPGGSSVSLAVVDSFEHSILRVDLP